MCYLCCLRSAVASYRIITVALGLEPKRGSCGGISSYWNRSSRMSLNRMLVPVQQRKLAHIFEDTGKFTALFGKRKIWLPSFFSQHRRETPSVPACQLNDELHWLIPWSAWLYFVHFEFFGFFAVLDVLQLSFVKLKKTTLLPSFTANQNTT